MAKKIACFLLGLLLLFTGCSKPEQEEIDKTNPPLAPVFLSLRGAGAGV